jgi:hypothetical protein
MFFFYKCHNFLVEIFNFRLKFIIINFETIFFIPPTYIVYVRLIMGWHSWILK